MYYKVPVLFLIMNKFFWVRYNLSMNLPTSKPLKNEEREKKKDEDKGKGRRLCFLGRINSIPCRASCFAQDDFNYRMNRPSAK